MLEAPHEGRSVPVLLMVRELGAGGTERQMTVARALDRERFTPHVACFYARGFRADDLNASGIPVLELPLRSFLTPDLIRAALTLRTYLRRHSIRLVHTFDYPSNIFGIPAARLCGIPHVLGSQRGYRTVYRRRHRLFLRAGDLLADGIVVNCEAMRHHLSRDYSVPERKSISATTAWIRARSGRRRDSGLRNSRTLRWSSARSSCSAGERPAISPRRLRFGARVLSRCAAGHSR